MERKYRQAGYMDSDREEKKHRSPRPQEPREFRSRPMPAFNEVVRCALCGARIVDAEIDLETRCPKCKADLHTCKQCTHFDTSTRYECTQPIPERLPRKSVRNQCSFFKMKKSIERETTSTGAGKPSDARQAFDNLFKK
ncbi:MAG TPA: hypothetical protein VMW38_12570 [Terriglobia bacterium]|nr:hypothetical protein [Terriglobia bacterium]